MDYKYFWDQVEGREALGIVHIIHGMAEHMARYDEFARFLNDQGYIACGIDLLGHGKNKGLAYGFFAEEEGDKAVIDSLLDFNREIREKYPNKKIICLGHSMGSFFALYLARNHNDLYDAFMFSGTQGPSSIVGLASVIAKAQVKFKGSYYESRLLKKLSFDAYNKKIKDPETDCDWLSRDRDKVKAYVEDDLCGFTFTASAYRDVFKILTLINRKDFFDGFDKEKQHYLFSGNMDFVSNKGKGVEALYKKMLDKGINVKMKLYEGGRHEILNEINRDQVYQDLLDFLGGV